MLPGFWKGEYGLLLTGKFGSDCCAGSVAVDWALMPFWTKALGNILPKDPLNNTENNK